MGPSSPCPLGYLTNGDGCLLRMDQTESNGTGTVRGLQWHNRPMEQVCREVRIG